MTTVLLVDDHYMVRAGLAALIGAADDLEVVGEASDGELAVARALTVRPDVILMDLSMPVLDGVEATRRILAELPATRIVILSADTQRAGEAMAAGAVGYLLKEGDPRDLLAALRSAAQGTSQ
jgi:DNA-binding NarL/FixJ family response regulator